MQKGVVIWLVVFVLLIAAGFVLWPKLSRAPDQTLCTMEAKLCPDGSYVGRTGPACEFAACPGESGAILWKAVGDTAQGIIFQYPERLDTKYITPVEWPPKIKVEEKNYSCIENPAAIILPGETRQVTFDGRLYCVHVEAGGAAGSTYTTYTYTTAKDGKLLTLTFALRAPQCANYDEPNKTECEVERARFDVDLLADTLLQKVELLGKG